MMNYAKVVLTVNAQLVLGGDLLAHVVLVVVVVGSAGDVLEGFGAAGNGLGARLLKCSCYHQNGLGYSLP